MILFRDSVPLALCSVKSASLRLLLIFLLLRSRYLQDYSVVSLRDYEFRCDFTYYNFSVYDFIVLSLSPGRLALTVLL